MLTATPTFLSSILYDLFNRCLPSTYIYEYIHTYNIYILLTAEFRNVSIAVIPDSNCNGQLTRSVLYSRDAQFNGGSLTTRTTDNNDFAHLVEHQRPGQADSEMAFSAFWYSHSYELRSHFTQARETQRT